MGIFLFGNTSVKTVYRTLRGSPQPRRRMRFPRVLQQSISHEEGRQLASFPSRPLHNDLDTSSLSLHIRPPKSQEEETAGRKDLFRENNYTLIANMESRYSNKRESLSQLTRSTRSSNEHFGRVAERTCRAPERNSHRRRLSCSCRPSKARRQE
jgi:hypothetical protein